MSRFGWQWRHEDRTGAWPQLKASSRVRNEPSACATRRADQVVQSFNQVRLPMIDRAQRFLESRPDHPLARAEHSIVQSRRAKVVGPTQSISSGVIRDALADNLGYTSHQEGEITGSWTTRVEVNLKDDWKGLFWRNGTNQLPTMFVSCATDV